MGYTVHYTMRDLFNSSGATVEDETVVGAPDLKIKDDTFSIGSVGALAHPNGHTVKEVKLENADRHWLGFSLSYDPQTKEWSLTSLADKLNELLVIPDCVGGKVALERWEDDKYWKTRLLTDEEFGYLGLAPDEEYYGSLEAHPEGADRGGYVPTLNSGPYHMSDDGWK